MKLIEILACELKEWPEGFDDVGQADFGALHLPGIGKFVRHTGETYTKSDDWLNAIVTRAEWQAAVDALNKPAGPVWNGEGLPPVGALCEYDARTKGDGKAQWFKVKIEYLSEWNIVFSCVAVPEGGSQESIGVELAYDVRASSLGVFRPILTPEQIAADEREKAIAEMVDTLGCDPEASKTGEFIRCGVLYDAGYRKQEAS